MVQKFEIRNSEVKWIFNGTELCRGIKLTEETPTFRYGIMTVMDDFSAIRDIEIKIV